MLSAALLLGRPSAHSSGGGHASFGGSSSHTSSYGVSQSFSRPSSSSATATHASPPKVWGSSTTYTKESKAAWGSSTATAVPARSTAEAAINRKINQTDTASGGISRAAAVKERDAVIAQSRGGAAGASARDTSAPAAGAAANPNTTVYHTTVYNSRVDYVTARGFRHYYTYQPSIWPQDIPYFLMYGGIRRSILWDPFYHSYGWYGPDNSWTYYDSAVASSRVAPVAVVVTRPETNPDDGGFLKLVLDLLIVLIVLALAWIGWKSWQAARKKNTAVAPAERPRGSYQAPVADEQREHGAFSKGGLLRLSDAISMEDARKLDPNSPGLFVTVDRVLTIREKNDLCTWTCLYGTSEFENQEVLVKIKEADGQKTMACYTRDLEGSRQDLIDQNDFFLFSKPEDEAHFNPMELRLAREFTHTLGGAEEKFALIHPHELHGSARYNPAPKGVEGEVLATVAEWRNVARPANEYLAIETGTAASSNVETWWGDRLLESEVEFLGKA